MNKLKKGSKLKNGTVLSSNYFTKRREVMDIIYQARKLYPNAPRTEVKIMTGASGLGWTNSNNIISIGEDVSGENLVHVVLHELVHTWFKISKHNEKCPLMKAKYGNESAEVAWSVFSKYADKDNKKDNKKTHSSFIETIQYA